MLVRTVATHGLRTGRQPQNNGYHVELCERVLKEIAPTAKLEYMAITAQSTMPLVSNGTVDIGCGPTTNNLGASSRWRSAVTSLRERGAHGGACKGF